eukprot:scaffold7362_cov266-Pinguiococcus_pyrenoidosus.AAC.28
MIENWERAAGRSRIGDWAGKIYLRIPPTTCALIGDLDRGRFRWMIGHCSPSQPKCENTESTEIGSAYLTLQNLALLMKIRKSFPDKLSKWFSTSHERQNGKDRFEHALRASFPQTAPVASPPSLPIRNHLFRDSFVVSFRACAGCAAQ